MSRSVVIGGALAASVWGCSAAGPTNEVERPPQSGAGRDDASISASPASASPASASPVSAPSLLAAPAAASTGSRPRDNAAKTAPDEPPPMEIPRDTVVLHFGDSMVFAGFNQALSPRLRKLGVRFAVRSETGSSTVHWSPKVGQLVADTQPDLVIINLGGNEIGHDNPEALVPVVRHIVDSIGGRPCVWVSPPLWRGETGILEVIKKHSAPCRFFDSNVLVEGPIERKADGIHPNLEGGAKWADVFWQWLMHERRGVESPWELKPAPEGEHG